MKSPDYYRYRKLTASVPGMEEEYVRLKRLRYESTAKPENLHEGINCIIRCLEPLIDLSIPPRTIAVVGCGPNPTTISRLKELQFDAVGVEPVEQSLQSARHFLKDETLVKHGNAEAMPFSDNSQRVVLMESVLEHVDSPMKSLAEAYRVIAPGGVLFIRTTNRWRFSPLGRNWEFRVPFYNWFPKIVKESYVFLHLHYKPTLARYSPRPAVHWFTFHDLCALGREAGFAQFYSPTDLFHLHLGKTNPDLRGSFIDRLRRNPWLRALNLTQIGGDIYMWKRT